MGMVRMISVGFELESEGKDVVWRPVGNMASTLEEYLASGDWSVVAVVPEASQEWSRAYAYHLVRKFDPDLAVSR